MPRIFGQEIQGKTLWIILGVIAAGVAVVVYVRSQSGGDAGGAVPQATPDAGYGGGGGGISVAAPSPGQADSYNSQLEAIQLDAARFGLERQRQEAANAQRAFDLNAVLQEGYNQLQLALFGQQQQVGEAASAYEAAGYGLRTVQIGKQREEVESGRIRGECGKGESSYYDRNTGTFLCKASGKSGVKSAGDALGGGLLEAIAGAGDWLRGAVPAYLTGATGIGSAAPARRGSDASYGGYTPPIAQTPSRSRPQPPPDQPSYRPPTYADPGVVYANASGQVWA